MDKISKNKNRMNPEPQASDLSDAERVWPGGETDALVSPATVSPSKTGMLGRVADAGDLGTGNPTPYTLDVQAEILSKEKEDLGETAPQKPKNIRPRA